MVVTLVAAAGKYFGYAEAVALRSRDGRLTEHAHRAPIERQCFHIGVVRDEPGS